MDIVALEHDCLRFQDASVFTGAFQQFERIRNLGKFCDVTLIVDGRQFSAHKIVLAASIPYFQGMFMHDMVESAEKNIELHGLDPGSLEALINFAYRGEVFITPHNVQSIFMGANFLQITSVRVACCEFMKNRITNQTVLPLRSFAKSLFCHDLLHAADIYIYKNFMSIINLNDFYDLPFEDLLEIICKDDLCVTSEENVFEAVIKWIEYSASDRKHYLADLMKQIRFPQISAEYLLDTVGSNQVIQNSLKCRNVLDATKDFLILPQQMKNLEPHNFRPRFLQNSLYGFIFVIGGSFQNDSQVNMEVYHPILRQWCSLEQLGTNKTRVGVAVLNHCIYVIGGFDGIRRLSHVDLFNTKTMKWSSVANMNCNRSALGATMMNDKIYVCGGYDGTIALKSCEEYCPKLNRWRVIPPMLECRSATGVVHLSQKLFAIGGHNGLAIDNSVECFNPVKKCWDFITPMLNRRCRHGVAVLNQSIYAAGGYDGVNFLSSVEVYNVTTNQWTNISSMKVPRSRMSLISTFGEIYAIGGFDGSGNLKSVECFNARTHQWFETSHLLNHDGGIGCAIVAFSDVHLNILSLFKN